MRNDFVLLLCIIPFVVTAVAVLLGGLISWMLDRFKE